MTQVIKIHRDRYPKMFDFLSQELPGLKQSGGGKIWNAFMASSRLSDAEATAVMTMGGGPPLVFVSDLGTATWGQFDPEIPGRIEISKDVLEHFEEDSSNPKAQSFLRAKVLHEICHWGCFQKKEPETEEVGRTFEQAAFGEVQQPWWLAVPPAGQAAGQAAGVPVATFTDADRRAELLVTLLNQKIAAPGRAADPGHMIVSGADVAKAMPRGFRNNNPGNIRIGPSQWRGLMDPADPMPDFQRNEASFCVFREPEWGLRVIAFLLRKYKRENFSTPRRIIGRWAPTSDGNDVESYSGQLAKALNVDRDAEVNADDDGVVVTMMKAIAKHENGDTPPYAEVQFRTALRLL